MAGGRLGLVPRGAVLQLPAMAGGEVHHQSRGEMWVWMPEISGKWRMYGEISSIAGFKHIVTWL